MTIEFFQKQVDYLGAVMSGKYKYLLYGGAIRGGKTWVVLYITCFLCKKYPGSRWAVVRKDLPTLRRNTIPSFMRIKGDNFTNVNQNTWTSTYKPNGSEIIFFPESIEKDPDLDRWKGLEVNGFILEEANEIQEKSFNKAIERAGTLVLEGDQPKPIIMLTCNPSQGWVKSKFYNPWKTKTLEAPFYYLPARADDNPHIPEEVRESWKNLPENEYRRFVLGDWDVADDPDQLIKFEYIASSYEVDHEPGRQMMGIDVARFGDDSTVFSYFEGNELKEFEAFSNLSIDQTASYAQARISERGIGADMVGVDVVGLGAGVADILRASGFNVLDIVSGGAPIMISGEEDTLYTFKNLRSQMWWTFREALRLGKVRIGEKARDQRLIDDLLSVKYKMSADKVIQVESKDDIKKRLGRSTDYGDGAIYAWFVQYLDHAHVIGFY